MSLLGNRSVGFGAKVARAVMRRKVEKEIEGGSMDGTALDWYNVKQFFLLLVNALVVCAALRTCLSLERTLCAWLRTSLSCLGHIL